ncbi:hypothetical protein J1N35_004616 [Gossypium stocksii]|uniref:Uncharacterized protein n=1 Tax=Gossypium stocksii TaxID=47602 RepID=A0A9D3WCI7_9ROSI|nr:hypothetical protein J1N35_004616 [Gossypium stocksii]
MSRMRGAHGQLFPHCPPRERASKTLVEANIFPCTTKYEKMHRALRARGIEIPNFAYKFSPEGSHRLGDTSDGSFLLPLHALEVGFYLPLNPSFAISLMIIILLLVNFVDFRNGSRWPTLLIVAAAMKYHSLKYPRVCIC